MDRQGHLDQQDQHDLTNQGPEDQRKRYLACGQWPVGYSSVAVLAAVIAIIACRSQQLLILMS